ncbi:hypothetical protein CRYUN_Cryun10bG0053100 [Craigia yunnanensis]
MYMDSIKVEKFQAMKKYRKSQFLHNFLLHLLAGLACSLFFSNPFWFPSLCSSMKHFFIISLPCIWSSFFNPKCLFIVVNVIVVFLIGESRLSGPNSSPGRDIYNEYTERSRRLRGVSALTPQEKIREPQEKRVEEVEKKAELKEVFNTVEDKEVNSKEENEELVEMKEVTLGGKEEKEEEKEIKVKEVIITEVEEAKQEDRVGEETSEIVEEEAAYEEAYEDKEREIFEEEVGLPAEELNKRVEEFIARVNKQRWLEAQLLVRCKA